MNRLIKKVIATCEEAQCDVLYVQSERVIWMYAFKCRSLSHLAALYTLCAWGCVCVYTMSRWWNPNWISSCPSFFDRCFSLKWCLDAVPHNASLQGSVGRREAYPTQLFLCQNLCTLWHIIIFFFLKSLKVDCLRSIFIFYSAFKISLTLLRPLCSLKNLMINIFLSLIESLSPNLFFLYTHIHAEQESNWLFVNFDMPSFISSASCMKSLHPLCHFNLLYAILI